MSQKRRLKLNRCTNGQLLYLHSKAVKFQQQSGTYYRNLVRELWKKVPEKDLRIMWNKLELPQYTQFMTVSKNLGLV